MDREDKSMDVDEQQPGEPEISIVIALGEQLAELCKKRCLLSARARIDHERRGDTSTIEIEIHNASDKPQVTVNPSLQSLDQLGKK